MDNAALYYAAALPEPPKILGLQMRPYSLGHQIILSRHGCEILNGTVLYSDFIFSVLVCSHTWEDWGKNKDSWLLPFFLKFWGWKNRKADLKEESRKFLQYLDDGRFHPDINRKEGGKELQIPCEARLKVLMMKELGLNESEVLNRPLSLCHWEWCALGEMNGSIELFSNRDEALFEYHRKRLESESLNN